MPLVSIVYFSHEGTTDALARAIADGVASVANAEARLHRIAGDDIEHGHYRDTACLDALAAADGIVFGSPTWMGGPAAQFKAFADATGDRWADQPWAGKVAAGFTVGANPNGDQLATLVYLSVLAAQHGMLWTGLDIPGGFDPDGRNRSGTQLGLAAHARSTETASATLDPSEFATAHHLGERVARLCTRLGDA